MRSNKVQDRLSVSKARLGSIGIQLQNQLGMLPAFYQPREMIRALTTRYMEFGHRPNLPALAKVTGSLQKSAEIMKLTNSLVNLPQISAAMRDMSMEMTKVLKHLLSKLP